MDSRIARLKDELSGLCRQMRKLQKDARNKIKRERSHFEPSRTLKLKAVLSWLICQDESWALKWTQQAVTRRALKQGKPTRQITATELHSWRHQFEKDDELLAAQQQLDHPWHIQIDTFWVESMVWNKVREANARGVHMPSGELLNEYIKKWSLRPRAQPTDNHLTLLQAKHTTGRKWEQHFRRRWNCKFGQLTNVRSLPSEEFRKRAGIFIRWTQWLLQQKKSHGPCVVVNLDETSVSNLRHSQNGTVISSTSQMKVRVQNAPAPRTKSKATLMACVCNDNRMQKHMPQVWLPRWAKGRLPSSAFREVFTHAGYPQEAWHGQHTWLLQRTMLAWLQRLRRRVDNLRTGVHIILIMDVCPVHVAPSVATMARQLQISLAFVPARCTWLLQPADTHVFAKLKQKMRHNIAHAKLQATDGTLQPPKLMTALTAAVNEVLVQGQWSHAFHKNGIHDNVASLRKTVLEMLEDEDLTPRPPTRAELMLCLGAHRKHCETLLEQLFDCPTLTQTAQITGSSNDATTSTTGRQTTMPILVPFHKRMDALPNVPIMHHAGAHGAACSTVPRGRLMLPCPRNLVLLANHVPHKPDSEQKHTDKCEAQQRKRKKTN